MKNITPNFNIEEEIQKTLHCEVNKIKASPFFYAKLEQRMRDEQKASQNTIWQQIFLLLGPTLQPALLIVLAIGSIYSGVLIGNSSVDNTTQEVTAFVGENTSDYLDEVVTEYALGNSEIYNYSYIQSN